MRRFLALASLLGTMVLGSAGQAAEADEAGPEYPKAGSWLPGPFHILNLTGYRKDRFHCQVCQNSTLPTVALLVRLRNGQDPDDGTKQLDLDQPLGKFLYLLDRHLNKNPDGNMVGFVSFFGPEDDWVVAKSRLYGLPDQGVKSFLEEAKIQRLVFGFDTVKRGWKYFADIEKNKGLPEKQLIRVLMYENCKLIYDVRDFTAERPMTDKDVELLMADIQKFTPPPVVNRKKFRPMP
jgi:hypothetical protein